MKKPYTLLAALGLMSLMAASCSSSSSTNYNNPTPTSSVTNTSMTLNTSSNSQLGQFLVAQNGMTLYKYSNDTANTSNCYGDCATVWPPYIIASGTTISAMSGINGTLSTTQRTDGTAQVTYNGMPLYFYTKDVNVGDTNGQNVGSTWFVEAP